MAEARIRERTYFDSIRNQLRGIRRDIILLQNRKTYTLPVYNKASLPPDLQPTQLFLATDGDLCWVDRLGAIHAVTGTII